MKGNEVHPSCEVEVSAATRGLPASGTTLERLKSELAWLAGSLAALTGALYAVGFMAIQAHLNLLGVSRLVQVQNRDYLITGAEFLLFLPIYMVIGLIPWTILARLLRWLTNAAARSIETTLVWMFVILCACLAIWIMWLTPPLGLLLAEASSRGPLHGFILVGEEGRSWLQVAFCAYIGLVAILVFHSSSLWTTSLTASWARALRIAYFVGLLLALAFIPISFGFYVIPIKYPQATIQLKQEKPSKTIKGWVLNRNLGGEDKALLLYPERVDTSGPRIITIIPSDSYSSIDITGYNFIFPSKPPVAK